jgi:hypothetical protein
MDLEKAFSSIPAKQQPLVRQAVQACLTASNTQDFSVVMQNIYACAQAMAQTQDKSAISLTMKHIHLLLKHLPKNLFPAASVSAIKQYNKSIINRLFPTLEVDIEQPIDTESVSSDASDPDPPQAPAPVPQAPAPVPQAPVPQAPVPQAPVPQAPAPISLDQRYAQLLDSYTRLNDTVQHQQAEHDADIDQLKKAFASIASTQQRILNEVTALKNNAPEPTTASGHKLPLLQHHLLKASSAINEALNSLLLTL